MESHRSLGACIAICMDAVYVSRLFQCRQMRRFLSGSKLVKGTAHAMLRKSKDIRGHGIKSQAKDCFDNHYVDLIFKAGVDLELQQG